MQTSQFIQHQYDVIVIGGGAAGLTLALNLADQYQVAILSKGQFTESSTFYAQGGIAAVLGEDDTIESHIEDTLQAGAGLSDPAIVRFMAENAKTAVNWLVKQGVAFTKERRPDGRLDYHLSQEGGHSRRRVIHAEDATGQAIGTTLTQKVKQHPNISIFVNYTAADLLCHQRQVTGLTALNPTGRQCEHFFAPIVVLATGGASKAYLYTSNPDGTSGDGIAMAWRAGCRVANLEFNQFHPTCLYHPEARSFLITEAVRGEGGLLLLPDGSRFMDQYDPRAELAPRDIVARAIDYEMKKQALPCLYLDIHFRDHAFIQQHFPNVYQRCLQYGFDMTKVALPIVPAAHYTCGGVMTDCFGQTDLTGLYAIGEVAHTGLHGANRMASNSLLECLVIAKSASEAIRQQLNTYTAAYLGTSAGKHNKKPAASIPSCNNSAASLPRSTDTALMLQHNWHALRQLMWDYVGIVRSNARLQSAKKRLALLSEEIETHYETTPISKNSIELRNLSQVARLIVDSALARKESRGLHFNTDYPDPITSHVPRNTILNPMALSVTTP